MEKVQKPAPQMRHATKPVTRRLNIEPSSSLFIFSAGQRFDFLTIETKHACREEGKTRVRTLLDSGHIAWPPLYLH